MSDLAFVEGVLIKIETLYLAHRDCDAAATPYDAGRAATAFKSADARLRDLLETDFIRLDRLAVEHLGSPKHAWGERFIRELDDLELAYGTPLLGWLQRRERVLRRLARLLRNAGPVGGKSQQSAKQPNGKGKGVREKMQAYMREHPESCFDLTAREYAEKLGCRESTVVETDEWKAIMLARARREADRVSRHNFRPGDKRKLNHRRSEN
jgi:hypothetical protein